MTTNAWPFLISRNQKLDYRVIAAPDFVIDANAVGLLNRELAGSESSTIRHKTLSAKNLGTLTAIFRTQPATKDGNVLLDAFHRPISRTDGIILKGAVSISDIDYEGLLKAASKKIGQEFERFWGQTEPAKATAMTGLNIANNDKKSQLKNNQSGASDTASQLQQILAQQRQSDKVIKKLRNQQHHLEKQLSVIKFLIGIIIVLFLVSALFSGGDDKKPETSAAKNTNTSNMQRPTFSKSPKRTEEGATEKKSTGFFSWPF